MTENNQAAAGADAPGGLPFYEQSRTQLKSLLARRRELEKKLVSVPCEFPLLPVARGRLLMTHSAAVPHRGLNLHQGTGISGLNPVREHHGRVR